MIVRVFEEKFWLVPRQSFCSFQQLLLSSFYDLIGCLLHKRREMSEMTMEREISFSIGSRLELTKQKKKLLAQRDEDLNPIQ